MKTVIEMAREAGFNVEQGFLLRVTGIDEDLERFAELVRADSRNATLDEISLFIENYVEEYDRDYRDLGLELADEIQARKT